MEKAARDLPFIKPEESIMLFHVKMTVSLPVDMNPERAAQLKADEMALAQRPQ
jgi:hypothetical protein